MMNIVTSFIQSTLDCNVHLLPELNRNKVVGLGDDDVVVTQRRDRINDEAGANHPISRSWLDSHAIRDESMGIDWEVHHC